MGVVMHVGALLRFGHRRERAPDREERCAVLREETVLEERQAAWMRRAAPSMACVEVPNVGHAPMLTETVALDAVLGFLAQVP